MISRALKTSAAAILLSAGLSMSVSAPASAFDFNINKGGCFPSGNGNYTCLDFSGQKQLISTGQYRRLARAQSGQSTTKNKIKHNWKKTLKKYTEKYIK